MNSIVLIPAWQPDWRLIDLLQQLQQKGFDLLVVDDGSDASCDMIFMQAADYAQILKHPQNRGKGAALKTGLTYLNQNHWQGNIILADADGQHTPQDIEKLAGFLDEHPDTFCIGSRRFAGSVPFRSKIGNVLTRWIFVLFTGNSIQDTQSGLRAFPASMSQMLCEVDGDRYEYEMNVLLKLTSEKVKIAEIPIETVYLEQNASSHFRPVQDSWRIIKEILRFAASSLCSFVIDYCLFSLLYTLGGSLIVSNILARIVSGTCNYCFNRKFVFRSNASLRKSALAYLGLALCVLAGSTLLLEGFTHMGMNAYIAKIFSEMIMFAVSWFFQHEFIFKIKPDAARK